MAFQDIFVAGGTAGSVGAGADTGSGSGSGMGFCLKHLRVVCCVGTRWALQSTHNF